MEKFNLDNTLFSDFAMSVLFQLQLCEAVISREKDFTDLCVSRLKSSTPWHAHY